MVAEQLRVEQADFVAAVAGKLTDFLTTRHSIMTAISPDIDPIMGSISNLVTGGKRLRALMCYWGGAERAAPPRRRTSSQQAPRLSCSRRQP
jgi:geranylgeranyl diphosphate synthase type I